MKVIVSSKRKLKRTKAGKHAPYANQEMFSSAKISGAGPATGQTSREPILLKNETGKPLIGANPTLMKMIAGRTNDLTWNEAALA